MHTQAYHPFGSLIMAGLPGTELDNETLKLIRLYGVGNFIIFRRNSSRGPYALKKLCMDLKNACDQAGLPPPVISVDQEGGSVQRLGPPFWKDLPSAQEAGNADDTQNTISDLAGKTARMLLDAGINMNMAPVLDIAGPAAHGVLKGRCFGSSATAVSMAGRCYIERLQEGKTAAVAKHFPGLGLVHEDPHMKRPVVTAPVHQLNAQIAPFRQAVESGVSAIMTSHVIFTALDEKLPASFSSAIAGRLLREKTGFSGVLITDDLEMGGITKYGHVPEAALQAFLAGHDMLLLCHKAGRVRETVMALHAAFKDGTVSRKRLDTSLERINRLRTKFCR